MNPETCNPILVHAWRGGIVESAHRGAFAVVDAGGALRMALGDIERPIFPRSACKVLQALPLVASGAADALQLNDEELALACASHGGEAAHARTAAAMLAKAGVDVSALECGAHWPYNEAASRELARRDEAPSALHNNCSGKHSRLRLPGLPAQRRTRRPARLSVGLCQARAPGDARGERRAAGHHRLGPVDQRTRHRRLLDPHPRGAAAPPGAGLCARGHRPGPERRPCPRRAAAAAGGGACALHGRRHGRFDTRVMERLGERVFCKVGAEGVHCAALPELGLGVAIKMDDGNNARACEVVLAALLQRLLPLADADAGFLRGLSPT
jgi:L-asparaginase II